MKKPDLILLLTVLILLGFTIQGRQELLELRAKQEDRMKRNGEQAGAHENPAGKFRVSLRSDPQDDRAAAEKLIADWREVAHQFRPPMGGYGPEELARMELAKLTAFERIRRVAPEHWAYIIENFVISNHDEQEELLDVMLDVNPGKLMEILLDSTMPAQSYSPKISALHKALESCAQNDPIGMIDWMTTHADEYPDLIGDDAKRCVVEGIAETDPMLALKSIRELGISDGGSIRSAMDRVFDTWSDAEPRMKKLEAIRAFRKEMDGQDLYYGSSYASIVFGNDRDNRDFRKITAFMESANLTQDELEMIARNAPSHVIAGHEVEWMDWLKNQNISKEVHDKCVESMPAGGLRNHAKQSGSGNQ